MSVRKKVSLQDFVARSPLFLGVFLLLPLIYIISGYAPFIRRIVPLNANLLMLNNVCFLVAIAVRFIAYLLRLPQELQYGAEPRPAGEAQAVRRPLEQVQDAFRGAGYRFDGSGCYAEKRTLAFLGTTILYGGLLFALSVGTYENLRQFSGTVFQGVGVPMNLADPGAYLWVTKGPLASTAVLPQLQVKKQILPNKDYPKGAVDIVLIGKDKKVLTRAVVARGGAPLVYNGYEYFFNRFLFDSLLSIAATNKYGEFSSFIKLQPMPTPQDGYSYYANFVGERARWRAMYAPERKALRLVALKQDQVLADGEIVFQKEPTKQIGAFIVSFEALAHWSEIHVVRTRHMPVVIAGAVVALIGLLMRLAFRPQRLWLEADGDGCRALAVGSETERLLQQ